MVSLTIICLILLYLNGNCSDAGVLIVEQTKAELARKANLARKAVLREVQSGVVYGDSETWVVGELNHKQMQDVIEKAFGIHLQKQD